MSTGAYQAEHEMAVAVDAEGRWTVAYFRYDGAGQAKMLRAEGNTLAAALLSLARACDDVTPVKRDGTWPA